MNSRNQTPRNEKQQELIKRLEEIRQQRDSIQPAVTNDEKQPQRRNQRPRRNAEQQQPSRRNRPDAQTARTNRQARTEQQASREMKDEMPVPSSLETIEDGRINPSVIRQERLEAQRHAQRSRQEMKDTKKKDQKTLIKKLSDADQLSDAIILNEILSKPIALRYKNR